MQDLIYLHGFLSSPQSEKAQQTLAFVRKHYPALNVHTPQLSGNIDKAVSRVESLIATLPSHRSLRFIGSSMGGFLSSYFVEKYADLRGAKAVIINPAVRPYELLLDYMGEHINPYSGEKFSIHIDSIAQLKAYDSKRISVPKNYKVLLQSGDETLDYRQAHKKYAGSDLSLEYGGNHSFINYDKHLPDIFDFLITS